MEPVAEFPAKSFAVPLEVFQVKLDAALPVALPVGSVVIVSTKTFVEVRESVSDFVLVAVSHPLAPSETVPKPGTVIESAVEPPPSVKVTDTDRVPVPSQPDTMLLGSIPVASENVKVRVSWWPPLLAVSWPGLLSSAAATLAGVGAVVSTLTIDEVLTLLPTLSVPVSVYR